MVDTKANTITYKLTYDALEGTVQQSHVHFGQMSVNGGVSFFLCSNLGNGPAGTQACPTGPAEVTGVITPELVIGPAGQGIEAGAFAEIVAAMRDGTAYANVHSSQVAGRRNPRSAALIRANGRRPAPRKGAGRGLPYNFNQKLSPRP